MEPPAYSTVEGAHPPAYPVVTVTQQSVHPPPPPYTYTNPIVEEDEELKEKPSSVSRGMPGEQPNSHPDTNSRGFNMYSRNLSSDNQDLAGAIAPTDS